MVAIRQGSLLSDDDNYLIVEGEIPSTLSSGSYISIDRKAPLKIYSLGFQPAKTIPEIPRWLLGRLATPRSVVLDPFAGSGTTLLESIVTGADVLWTDYHPLSRLLCMSKTGHFLVDETKLAAERIVEAALATKVVPVTVMFANKDLWFQKPAQEGLELLCAGIALASQAIQPLLWIAFSETVRKVSNMNEGMLLAARRPAIWTAPHWERVGVFQCFLRHVYKAIDAIQEWGAFLKAYQGTAAPLATSDAKNLQGDWRCDLVITSPPYLNAIDYVWASKFELHWLGLVKSDQERLRLYANEIGTERISASERKEIGRTEIVYLDRLIEDIYYGRRYEASKGQNQLRARVVHKYFMDMKQHFMTAFQHIRPGGYYCFTVGDFSRICGVEIPVATLLSEIATECGFCEEFRFHLLLKNRRLNIPRNVKWAGTIKHDTTILLKRLGG